MSNSIIHSKILERDIFGKCISAMGCNCRAFTEMLLSWNETTRSFQCLNCPHTSNCHELVGMRCANGGIKWFSEEPATTNPIQQTTASVVVVPYSKDTAASSRAAVLNQSEHLAFFGNKGSSSNNSSERRSESQQVFSKKSAKDLVLPPPSMERTGTNNHNSSSNSGRKPTIKGPNRGRAEDLRPSTSVVKEPVQKFKPLHLYFLDTDEVTTKDASLRNDLEDLDKYYPSFPYLVDNLQDAFEKCIRKFEVTDKALFFHFRGEDNALDYEFRRIDSQATGKGRNDLVRTGYNNKNFPQRRTFTAWAENSKTNPVVVMPYVGNYCYKYE